MQKFLREMLSEENGLASTKRVLFFLAVVGCLLFSAAHLVRHGLDDAVIDLAKTILLTTAGAYGITRFAEREQSP